MNTFSQIFEDYNLGLFILTRVEFFTYKDTIDKILKTEFYPKNLLNIDGLKFVESFSFEKERLYSLINYANTNTTLLKWMVAKFNLKSKNELIAFIIANKEDLFKIDGIYFKDLYQVLKNTERIGEENEQLAVEYMKSIIKIKKGIDID